mmetsp:Transcript_22950/g.44601  ORF Transcript_22950/g.44601 Transcript_22950/m.44601 type:complete len:104 (-) Transcript_22950:361-672(-)
MLFKKETSEKTIFFFNLFHFYLKKYRLVYPIFQFLKFLLLFLKLLALTSTKEAQLNVYCHYFQELQYQQILRTTLCYKKRSLGYLHKKIQLKVEYLILDQLKL